MLSLNKSYSRSSFKQNLWGEVSTECSGGAWSYSFSERRLFFVLSVITVLLMVVYFTGRIQEIKGLMVNINSMDKINTEKMNDISSPPSTKEDDFLQIQETNQ